MARLPDVTTLGNRPTPKPVGEVVTYKPTTGAEGAIGQALVNVGSSIERIRKEMEKEQERQDTLRAEDSFNQLQAKRLELTDGEDGFHVKKAGDAVNQPIISDYGTKFKSAATEIEESLANDRQREMFRRRAAVADIQFNQDLARHVTREREVYSKQVFDGGVAVEMKNAATSWNDPSAVGFSIERIGGLVEQQAKSFGWADDKKEAVKFEKISNLHSGVVMQMVADDSLAQAKEYFTANKSAIDTDAQLKLESLFKSRTNEIASELRVEIADKMQDVEAMGQRGVLPPKGFISDSDIELAYQGNPARVEQIKRRRDEAMRFASGVASLYEKSNEEIVKFVTETQAPSTSRPENFAEESRHQQQMLTMAEAVIKQRQQAPMEYAAAHGIGAPIGGQAVNPLDVSDPEAFSAELGNRQRVAKLMNDRFGSPIQLLTKQEASGLARAMDQMPHIQKAEYLKAIRSGTSTDGYLAVMKQIAPDDPVTAIAGAYAAKDRLPVSDLILRGQDILRPKKKEDGSPDKGKLWPMPADKELRDEFSKYEGDAFAGHPQARSDHYQAALAIYAAKSADAGDASAELDRGRWREAISMATGGIERWNGRSTVMPYGYDKGRFKTELYRRIDAMADGSAQAETPGLLEKGNIDVSNRPRVKNADGTISTVRSISINVDGKDVLIPTVTDDGRIVSDQEAIAIYKKSGKHLGVFESSKSATEYAQQLHTQQERALSGNKQILKSSRLKELPLEAIGDGRYVFRSGDGVIVDVSGKPVVIDFNTPLPRVRDDFKIGSFIGTGLGR